MQWLVKYQKQNLLHDWWIWLFYTRCSFSFIWMSLTGCQQLHWVRRIQRGSHLRNVYRTDADIYTHWQTRTTSVYCALVHTLWPSAPPFRHRPEKTKKKKVKQLLSVWTSHIPHKLFLHASLTQSQINAVVSTHWLELVQHMTESAVLQVFNTFLHNSLAAVFICVTLSCVYSQRLGCHGVK